MFDWCQLKSNKSCIFVQQNKQKMKTTTTEKEFKSLLAAKTAADKAFFAYRKTYNKEHGIARGIITDTIIRLHKKGYSVKDIIAEGFNKGTVRRQIRLFTKGKRVEKTTVAKYIPKKK